jgi:hypothetical protein
MRMPQSPSLSPRELGGFVYIFQASADSPLLMLLNMSTTEILTADMPVLNGNAPFPSSVIGKGELMPRMFMMIVLSI